MSDGERTPPEPPRIGIDLIEIERLEHALARRPQLAQRLFTASEREYAAARARPGQHLAARFCAKEAVAKALGMKAWSFTDVEIVSDGDGVPRVALHGSVAQRAAEMAVEVTVSLTHSRTQAAAVALASPARPAKIKS